MPNTAEIWMFCLKTSGHNLLILIDSIKINNTFKL